MSLDDLYSKPGHLMRRCQQIAVAIFMEETARFDITPVQYAALTAIRQHPDVDATRLSHLIAFDRSTLGDVLERLEAKGLIARLPGRDDKRTKRLHLTKTGQVLLADVRSAVERTQARILAPLKLADRRRFVAMLVEIVDINNGHSRAPLRTEAIRPPRSSTAGSRERRQARRRPS